MAKDDRPTSMTLVRPDVATAQAVEAARDCYGLEAEAVELGSNQDRNYLLTAADGRRLVLKVDNPVFSPDELDAQNSALVHLAKRNVAVAAVIPGLDGRLRQSWGGHSIRVFDYAGSQTLYAARYLAPSVIAELGALAGEVVAGLADFEHPGLERAIQWDLRRAADVVEGLLASVPAEEQRVESRAATDEALAALAPLANRLPLQAIHGDLTGDNVVSRLGEDARLHPQVVIDFGDLARSWRVAELAVTCASLLHHQPERPLSVLPAVRAFHAVVGLTVAEARALWPLVVLRGAVLVVSSAHQVRIEEGNDYALDRMEDEWTILATARSLSMAEATEAILVELGLARPPAEVTADHPLLPELAADHVVLDLTPESPLLDAGRWLDPAAEGELVAAALEHSANVVLPYGAVRLTRTVVEQRTPGAVFPVSTVVVTRDSQPVHSPSAGVVTVATESSLSVRLAHHVLTLDGLSPAVAVGEQVRGGQWLGQLMPGALRVSLLALGSEADDRPLVPSPETAPAPAAALVSAERMPTWRRLAPDPAPLLGLEPMADPATAPAEQSRRQRVFSSAQERYYEDPVQVERGWRHHLVDTTGRAYVDMVNNVTPLGHGHPRVTATVARQTALLNTNSRFLYRSLAELSERLVALAPGSELDTVLLVNSGTEAVDLALRLARIATGRETVVALREAYHGWSVGSDAISTSAYDNPEALTTRPTWVHVADVPNPLRGRHLGADSGAACASDLETDLARLAAEGRPVAGFICESILGNAGGVLLPNGYLPAVYAAVRAAGGLAIADEVQVGYGRTGDHFWGFERQGVVPDVITCAKPMGNGYPVGAVITTRAIAESLGREGTFFSSTGGSPVSCQVAITVLDVLRDEGLQVNARVVGEHLRARLAAMGERHPMVAAVHGAGLYLGVELVRDRTTLEPAAAETAAICERLLELGVIVQPTSERQNVLKIKPPLCLTVESADFVVDRIDEVLTNGW